MSELKHGRHPSKLLQKDFNEHGKSAFVFEKLKVVSKPFSFASRNQIAEEVELLNELRPYYNSQIPKLRSTP